MASLRKTLFISDLHLDENQPAITQQFLQLLNQLNSPLHPSIDAVDALYILGDLFEAWIGDDGGLEAYSEIIIALKKASQTTPIYFLHGNRDFLIGKGFLEQTGCRLLADETKINLYGQAVLLMHGDTLCTKDIAYIKARKILRHPFLQKLFLLLPLQVRKKIASIARKKSRQHTSSTSYEIMDVTQEEVLSVMQKQDVNYLIHGHTHQPGFHEFSFHNKSLTRIVLGAWHEQGNGLVWDETGKKELIVFNL